MPRPVKRVEIRGAFNAIFGNTSRGRERFKIGYPSLVLPDEGPLSVHLDELTDDTWQVNEDWIMSDSGRVQFELPRFVSLRETMGEGDG